MKSIIAILMLTLLVVGCNDSTPDSPSGGGGSSDYGYGEEKHSYAGKYYRIVFWSYFDPSKAVFVVVRRDDLDNLNPQFSPGGSRTPKAEGPSFFTLRERTLRDGKIEFGNDLVVFQATPLASESVVINDTQYDLSKGRAFLIDYSAGMKVLQVVVKPRFTDRGSPDLEKTLKAIRNTGASANDFLERS